MNRWLISLVTLICIPAALATELVPPVAVAEWLEKHPDAVFLDIRTPGEIAGGHAEGVVAIDWLGEDFEQRVKAELKPEQPVLLICRSGRRTSLAAEKLKKLGFTHVADVRGGMLAWREAKMPVVTPEP